jgi:hypothetical protein
LVIAYCPAGSESWNYLIRIIAVVSYKSLEDVGKISINTVESVSGIKRIVRSVRRFVYKLVCAWAGAG